MPRPPRLLLATLNAAGLLGALVCNGLANAVPLNGRTTGEVSALYPNLFVPAGVTFSIWGLIYLGLLGFVGAGFVLARRDDDTLDRIGPWFFVNTVANGAWIVAWHWTLLPLSVALMGVILASLIAMYLRLGVGRTPADRLQAWLIRAPIQVYLGWITVATIANLTALAVDLGAPAFGAGPAAATAAVLATAVGLTAAMLRRHRDVPFAGVVMWAFLGIALERAGSPQDGSDVVLAAAVAGLVLVGAGVAATLVRPDGVRAS